MHILVQTFHGVRKHAHIGHFRLAAAPLGEGVDLAKVFGAGDSALARGRQRILLRLKAGQVFDDVVRIPTEFIALVEVVGQAVVELDAKNAGQQQQRGNRGQPQQRFPSRHHEPAEAVEESHFSGSRRFHAQGQDGKQGRQQGHGIDEGAAHAEGDVISERVERRGIGGIQAQEPDHGRERSQKDREGVHAQRFGDCLHPVQSAAHGRQGHRGDMHRLGNRYRHDDDRHSGVHGTEDRLVPPRQTHRRAHRKQDHHDHAQGARNRTQDQVGHGNDQEEHDRSQPLQVVLGGLRKRALHHDVAGDMEFDLRALGARPGQHVVEVRVEFHDRSVMGLPGRYEIDGQAGHPAVFGQHAADKLNGVVRDFLDPVQVGVAQGRGVLHQWADDQVIAQCLAVAVVGQRVNAARIGRLPGLFGQPLDGPERLASEYGALPGRHGYQRRIRRRVGVLKGVVGDELRVVLAEQDPMVVGNRDEPPAGRHRQHDQGGAGNNQPAVAQDRGDVPVEKRRVHRAGP